MAEGGAYPTVECGYCLNKNDQLEDPRVLPCTHVYCRHCLAESLEEYGAVKCTSCRYVWFLQLFHRAFTIVSFIL